MKKIDFKISKIKFKAPSIWKETNMGFPLERSLSRIVKIEKSRRNLSPFGDFDSDKVPNWIDCNPRNKFLQENISPQPESLENKNQPKIKERPSAFYLNAPQRSIITKKTRTITKIGRKKKRGILENIKLKMAIASREKARNKIAERIAREEAKKAAREAKIRFARREAILREKIRMEKRIAREKNRGKGLLKSIALLESKSKSLIKKKKKTPQTSYLVVRRPYKRKRRKSSPSNPIIAPLGSI